ncbi:MAG: hypothetical protein V4787_09945 [Pseudomonadota bacterium]
MYPRIRDLLVHILNHPTARILVDAGIEGGRGIPDLTLRAPTGVNSASGDPFLTDWAVFEVKDEPGAFRSARSRETIFTEKAKYIGVGTEWFVMVDPTCIIARPVIFRSQLSFDPANDIEIGWDGLTEDQFRTRLNFFHFDNAGLSASVNSFRAGDVAAIAVVKLQVADEASLTRLQQARLKNARSDFFDTVSLATSLLQQACVSALEAQRPDIASIRANVAAFSTRWQGHELSFAPIRIRGLVVTGPNEAREHDQAAAVLKRDLSKRPSLSKLALQWLPSFHERMGATTRDEHFAIETANLVLARMLLIRFFEDHEFFGTHKYVCNGGVAAFQEMMTYFGEGYTQLLRHAYEKAHNIYASVFDEMAIAQRTAAALTLLHDSDLSRRAILDLPIPHESDLTAFVAHVEAYDLGQGAFLLDDLIGRIDELVGRAFGLTPEDITFIQQEMRNDPFLKYIRPNLPHADRRLRGLSDSLASPTRYRSAS